MKTFPTMHDVNRIIEEKEKNYQKTLKHMQFNINSHLLDRARAKDIATDISFEYPEIPEYLRLEIASMESPIKGCHEDYDMFYKDELRIYRLFNMLQILYQYKNYKNIFDKAYEDIKESYKMFLKHFTYANPGEQKVSMIMRTIKDFTGDTEIEIPEY